MQPHSTSILLAFAGLAASAAPAVAQVPPVDLVGGVAQAQGSDLVVLPPCSVPVTVCTPSTVAPAGSAGGTAYDPVNQVYWHSDGSSLESVFAPTGASCEMPCAERSPVANVTGLAFDARDSNLWFLTGAPELVRASVPRDATCPQVVSRCPLANVIPAGTVAAGLALSEKRGLLFVSASAGGNAPINLVLVTATADPCRLVCRIDLGPAFGSPQPEPITGLGYDDCALSIFNAPANGVAIPILGAGTCGSGIAALCGRFHPPLAPLLVVLPALPLSGGSPCTGVATLPIPIAADGSLCGLELCIQAVIACPAGGVGMTNALGIRIVGA